MGYCLRIGRDSIMFLRAQDLNFRLETGKDLRDEGDGGGGKRSVRNDNERLAPRVDTGSVETVAGDDRDIGRKMLLKGGDFGGFAGSLTTNYGADFGRRTVFSDDSGDELGFDAVDDVVADSRDKVPVAEDGQVGVGSGLVRLGSSK